MLSRRTLLCAVLIYGSLRSGLSQEAQPSNAPAIHVTSNLVFLDVTVLDKKGRPVVSGLSQDDFTITEEKIPQRIFSFEAPGTHVAKAAPGEEVPEDEAHMTIFVLDLLNSDWQDASTIRERFEMYLSQQPSQLSTPAELMVIGNNSLELLQGFTRRRDELLFALKHLRGSVPYKRMHSDFDLERIQQSVDALQAIVLQNRGISGRKNVIWIGPGAPSLQTSAEAPSVTKRIATYLHETTNMLVDARVSLFVVYPGPRLIKSSDYFLPTIGESNFDGKDPFGRDVNFADFVGETGGKLFYNRNDIDGEIKESLNMGAKFYTLTYQPHEIVNNGKYRRIRVTMRNPDLRAVTKSGYYAEDSDSEANPRHKAALAISDAIRTTIPLNQMELKILGIVQHPDSRTAELTVQVNSRNLEWHKRDDGTSAAYFYLGVASLSGDKRVLASKWGKLTGVMRTQDAASLAASDCEFDLPVRVPAKTRSVRVIVENEDSGRMGAIDVSRDAINAAPSKPTPQPPSPANQSQEKTPGVS